MWNHCAVRRSTVSTDASATDFLRLPDGRRLAYAEFGDPAGAPLVFLHGWGDSRLTRHPDDAATAALGVRLITVDRPGAGLSDIHAGRTLMDWPRDVAALADSLGIERFPVLGWSGAGPHAAACAHGLPERVTRLGIVCGFAPLDRPDGARGLPRELRLGLPLLRRAPWSARLFFATLPHQYARDPVRAWNRQHAGRLPQSDTAALAEPGVHANLYEGAAEALRAAQAWLRSSCCCSGGRGASSRGTSAFRPGSGTARTTSWSRSRWESGWRRRSPTPS